MCCIFEIVFKGKKERKKKERDSVRTEGKREEKDEERMRDNVLTFLCVYILRISY